MCHGVSLKSALLESDHARKKRRWRRRRMRRKRWEKPFLRCHTCVCTVSCHRRRNTQVPLSGAGANCLPPPFATNSLFRKWEEEGEITDQRLTNSLTSSSCLSTFRTSCVFSSEREREGGSGRGRGGGEKRKVRGWVGKTGNILISRQRNSTSWQQPRLPRNRGKRGGWGEEKREKRPGENTTHEDTFEDIFTHSLYTRSQHLMSGSYWRLWGLCWVFV